MAQIPVTLPVVAQLHFFHGLAGHRGDGRVQPQRLLDGLQQQEQKMQPGQRSKQDIW